MPKKVMVKMKKGEGDNYHAGEVGVVGEERVEYWVERERVWKEVQDMKNKNGDVEASWIDVEEIFIDEPEVIRKLVLA